MLALRDIARAWSGRPVLRGATLTLAPGKVTWLGGANGAGKTTLLRIACGLVAAENGSVELDGLDPVRDRQEFQRRLGFLSAGDRGLYARLTVAQNLSFWADLAFVPRERRSSAFAAATEAMELDELLPRRVDRLSMGQRQRVRLALAMLHEPDVLLLDEPQTSLDDDGLERLAAALDAHTARGGAALWCSPSLELGHLRADAAHRIEDGVVVPA